jgi:hypothetical protein
MIGHGHQQNHQQNQHLSGQGTLQGGSVPAQQLEPGNNSGMPAGSTTTGDLSALPANMVALFQQFLASIANKEGKGKSMSQTNEESVEKKKDENEMPLKDVAETSAQGEARGNNATNNPYFYCYLTQGAPKGRMCSVFVL